jgi:hypothetical protein
MCWAVGGSRNGDIESGARACPYGLVRRSDGSGEKGAEDRRNRSISFNERSGSISLGLGRQTRPVLQVASVMFPPSVGTRGRGGTCRPSQSLFVGCVLNISARLKSGAAFS